MEVTRVKCVSLQALLLLPQTAGRETVGGVDGGLWKPLHRECRAHSSEGACPGCASAWPPVHPAWGGHLRATGLGFEWQLKIDPVWSDFSV